MPTAMHRALAAIALHRRQSIIFLSVSSFAALLAVVLKRP